VPKVQHKPIKSTRKGSNIKSKRQPKGSPGLAHRTVSGAPGSSTPNLLPSEIRGGRSAIIHRTVRCTTGLSGVPSGATATRANGRLQRYSEQWTVQLRAQKSEQAPEGAPDTEQDMSGAPSDCPVAPLSQAPTVGTQRPGDVAGAPDCPVLHTIEAFTNGHFGGWGYKYPVGGMLRSRRSWRKKHLQRILSKAVPKLSPIKLRHKWHVSRRRSEPT
jgi:hypothetical protein